MLNDFILSSFLPSPKYLSKSQSSELSHIHGANIYDKSNILKKKKNLFSQTCSSNGMSYCHKCQVVVTQVRHLKAMLDLAFSLLAYHFPGLVCFML